MNIKEITRSFCCFLFLSFTVLSYGQTEINDIKVISQFGDNLETHFQTGIDLKGSDYPFFAQEDCEVIFLSKKRPGDIHYPCGNLILLQNEHMRYHYSHIADESYNERIEHYSQGEFIGLTGNSGTVDDDRLHIEIEDIKEHKLLNPAKYIAMPDGKKPVIQDLFFIDIHNREISLFQSKKVIRGGKLFIKCADYVDNNTTPLMPCQIEVFINGEEFCMLNFTSMDKKNNTFYLSDSEKDFFALYQINSPNVFFLKEQYFLPGLMGMKVVVKDYAGNSSSYITSFRVLPN